jgi:hypothetical protein
MGISGWGPNSGCFASMAFVDLAKFSRGGGFPQDGEQKNRRLQVNARLDNAFHRSRDGNRDDRVGTVSGTVLWAHSAALSFCLTEMEGKRSGVLLTAALL